jgi:hypothetical protein
VSSLAYESTPEHEVHTHSTDACLDRCFSRVAAAAAAAIKDIIDVAFVWMTMK